MSDVVGNLKYERGTLHERAADILNAATISKRALNPTEQAAFDKLISQQSELEATITRMEQHGRIGAELSTSQGRQTSTVLTASAAYAQQDRDQALRAWCLGPSRASVEMLRAADRIGIRAESREFGPDEMRALSVGTTDAGGYSVANEPMKSFWETLKDFGGVRPNATVLQTQTGAALPIPTVSDVNNVGEIIAEAGAVTTTADPTFGQVVLESWKYSSKAVIVSVELLQDSFINLPQYLGRALATRIARIQNTHFTTGDGSGKPLGIVTASSLGVTAAATNAVTFSEVVSLMHSVDPAYRAKGKFMMSDTVLAYIRTLKDTTGRFLWEMSMQAGTPDRIFGHEVVINNDMSSSLTSNNRVILFGDLSSYYIRDAGPVVMIRADEIRVLTHQVVFLCYLRSDGDLVGTDAVRYLRTA